MLERVLQDTIHAHKRCLGRFMLETFSRMFIMEKLAWNDIHVEIGCPGPYSCLKRFSRTLFMLKKAVQDL